ncbi:hypothetical protein Bbelb_091270 [Branchiostoma belcheri]|nr:hypothetical protein Bbelb_091270 [Branchiostoma belcheri]
MAPHFTSPWATRLHLSSRGQERGALYFTPAQSAHRQHLPTASYMAMLAGTACDRDVSCTSGACALFLSCISGPCPTGPTDNSSQAVDNTPSPTHTVLSACPAAACKAPSLPCP